MATVLVIDDDPQMRGMISRILATGTHQVFEAENGRDGMAKFHAHRPSLVITDIMMPEQEGLATIRELRRSDPAVPIIAMTGGAAVSNMLFLDAAKTFGANAILWKPFRAAELAQMVDKLLSA